MVIAFSTIPGYVSNRDREKGTWFIQSICKVLLNITDSVLKLDEDIDIGAARPRQALYRATTI